MKMSIQSNFHLLRTQVYEHLREELKKQNLKPGMFVTINQLSQQLGINRTPLRDALLQLQVEGFVTFLPQRGIQINELSENDLEDIYEVLGALDSRALLSVFKKITKDHIAQMKQINEDMYKTNTIDEYNRYFELNTDFHNVYLELSHNKLLLDQLSILRQRLFDFGAKGDWMEKVRELNYQEHFRLIDLIEQGNAKAVADFIRDTHCCINWK
ncbi:MAG: GntR family transcriptional regulator [Desulfobacula sp.]|nr:GntR family transcriptional regulator [Desulfobacula sp.]MCK5348775.1 GntR family transcriptional regulator [Desulfobacula sp.]